MSSIFYFILIRPLYNLLAILYLIFNQNLGWAILAFAIILRLLIWPWHQKITVSQKKMQQIQPKIKEIQKNFSNDPQEATKLIFKIFKEEKINPLGSFFYVFFQLVLFLGVFSLLNNLVYNGWGNHLYSFILKKEINYNFYNLINLKEPSFILALIYLLLTFFITLFFQKELIKHNSFYLFLPFLILLFYNKIPSAILIFWLGLSIVGLIQEILLNKKFIKNKK